MVGGRSRGQRRRASASTSCAAGPCQTQQAGKRAGREGHRRQRPPCPGPCSPAAPHPCSPALCLPARHSPGATPSSAVKGQGAGRPGSGASACVCGHEFRRTERQREKCCQQARRTGRQLSSLQPGAPPGSHSNTAACVWFHPSYHASPCPLSVHLPPPAPPLRANPPAVPATLSPEDHLATHLLLQQSDASLGGHARALHRGADYIKRDALQAEGGMEVK